MLNAVCNSNITAVMYCTWSVRLVCVTVCMFVCFVCVTVGVFVSPVFVTIFMFVNPVCVTVYVCMPSVLSFQKHGVCGCACSMFYDVLY